MSLIGATAAIDLAMSHPFVCEGLPLSFYERFLQCSSTEHRRDSLVHSMLESVDSYLWVRRGNVTAPQFRHLRELEMVRGKEHLAKQPFVFEKGVDGSTSTLLDLRFETLGAMPRSYEEVEPQWGAVLSAVQPACGVCGVPVHDSVGAPTTTVLFACGHAFHQLCVPDDACVSCLDGGLKSLADLWGKP